MVDPALIDPGKNYDSFTPGGGLPNGPAGKYLAAIGKAEKFHREILGNYYHPNTYVFYGYDMTHPSYGSIRWKGQWNDTDDLDEKLLRTAAPKSKPSGESVMVEMGAPSLAARQEHDAVARAMSMGGAIAATPLVNPSLLLALQPQDVPGDGTVSWQSGVSPKAQPGVRRVFRTTGFDHQGAYNDGHMRQLACYLICKIVQDAG